MHGSNIQGIVNMIKKDPKKFNDDLFTLEKKKSITHHKSFLDKRA